MQNPKLIREVKKNGRVKYVARYRDETGKQRKFSWEGTKDQAQQALNAVIQEVQEKKLGIKPSVKTGIKLSALTDRYLKHCKTNKSEATYDKAFNSLKQMVQYIKVKYKGSGGDIQLTIINKAFVDDYVSYRLGKVKPVTIKTQVGAIKACFSKGVDWGLITTNPWEGKEIKVIKEVPLYLSLEEIQKLLEEVKGKELENLIKFYLYTGCRRSEALALRVTDINMNAGTVTIRGDVAKSRKARVLSFRQLPQLKELIEGLKLEGEYVFSETGATTGTKGAPYDPQTMSKRVKRMFKKLGFNPNYKLHTLRATWCTWQLLQGTPITLVQAIGGWSSVTTLEKYYSALLATFSESERVVRSPY